MVGTCGTSCCTAPTTPAAVSLTLGGVGTGTEIGAAPAVAGGVGELETGFAGAVGAVLGRCGASVFAAACECLGVTLAVASRRAVCFATTPLGASTPTLVLETGFSCCTSGTPARSRRRRARRRQ